MQQIQFIVNTLAENYGFDATEALDYVLTVKREKSPAYARALKAIETTQEKISDLEQKIANNKVRNLDKAREKMVALTEKLATQEEKLEDIGKPKERKPRVPKEPKKEEKPKKEEPKQKKGLKPAEEKPKKEEQDDSKRLSRMSKVLTDKLEATFKEFGSDMNDKSNKAFVSYVNDLTKDDFDSKTTLTEHMRDFVILTIRPSDEDEAETLELSDLQKLKNLIDGYSAGIYWVPDSKKFVTGEVDDDEDVVETKFGDKNFMVGENTGRVYENINDEDIFVGYKGIGQFKGM
jgi:hypothetical protein